MPASPLNTWPLVALLMATPAIAQDASQDAPADPAPEPAARSAEEALDPAQGDAPAGATTQPGAEPGADAQEPAQEAPPATEPAGGAAQEEPGTDAEGGPATDAEAAGDQPTGLSLGEDGEPQVGQVYVREEFTDWELRCERAESGEDPCQLYQLLEDQEGNAVAEISMFALPEGSQAAAGATIVTPLMTLLTEQITLTVDGGTPKRYPFSWCTAIGCIARVGFTEPELQSFRRGSTATLSIVPVAAPDQTVDLDVSLSGFTAGFDAVQASGAAPQQ